MESDSDIEMRIQKTLISINDISLKIKKELKIIEELVKKDGHLHTVVKTANQTLSEKAEEMGMDVEKIIAKSKRNDRLERNALDPITSTIVTEKLLNLMDL